MKKVNTFYWIFTGLLSLGMLLSAVSGFVPNPKSIAMMQHIGFGPHVLPLLSFLKVLGVIALLIQRFPLLKEWAYAGFTFDLLGAIYSFIMVGDPASNWAPILLGFVLVFGSYIFWHKKLALMQQPQTI